MILTPIEIRDAIAMALSSVRANKMRAGLTILGVMIGVASVISLASIIDGLDGAMDEEIDALGSNSIFITRYAFDVDRSKLSDDDRNRPPISSGEARIIQEQCPSVDGVSPQNYYFAPGGNEVKYKNRKGNRPNLMGTWPAYLKVNNLGMEQGRFLTALDEQSRAMVCVIGHNLAEMLFESESPIDKIIRVNGNRFQVVGVFEEKESNFDNDNENNQVTMPLSTFEKIHPWEEELFLMARAESNELIDQAEEEIIGALRVYRQVPFNKGNNFALSTQESFKDYIANITQYIYLAMITITSVGLMVGGIGVMNIMLVSVTERTREIGVRKAIGAKRANIILQFLTEAVTLTGAGGTIGIVFGAGAGLAVNALLGFPLALSAFWILIGFTVSVSVGLISGIYPAYKAAALDPIESLRYE
ncbi:MAG: ABC transporter permease [candidate division Zixibacteria bacterium]|nr:ABC transporter permease [candidate division Zixibacteria bacterium]